MTLPKIANKTRQVGSFDVSGTQMKVPGAATLLSVTSWLGMQSCLPNSMTESMTGVRLICRLSGPARCS